MRKVHQKDQTQKQEEHGAEEGDVVAIDEEEGFGDKERHDDKGQPEDDLRTPKSILESGASIFRAFDAKKQKGEE